jgi:hypothetical protein
MRDAPVGGWAAAYRPHVTDDVRRLAPPRAVDVLRYDGSSVIGAQEAWVRWPDGEWPGAGPGHPLTAFPRNVPWVPEWARFETSGREKAPPQKRHSDRRL